MEDSDDCYDLGERGPCPYGQTVQPNEGGFGICEVRANAKFSKIHFGNFYIADHKDMKSCYEVGSPEICLEENNVDAISLFESGGFLKIIQ